jgi:hypothetical protein
MAAAVAERRYARAQIPWYLVQYITGGIDAATFDRRECRSNIRADAILCNAIMRERAGDAPGALVWYERYLALPRWQCGREYDPVISRFVEWRAAAVRGK